MGRKDWKSLIALALMAVCSLISASAQETNNSKPGQSPTSSTPTVINLWPGVAPGSEHWKQQEATLGSGPMQRIVNVTTPTLKAYLPDPAKVTGNAVIIAPGGGFIFLGTDCRSPKLRTHFK